MLLDTQDQEIVDQLPDLADLHATYGVQVNAIPVSELFALYERTGFLYPDKAARLTPHIEQVRDNWRRMLSAGESILYVLTAGDEERGLASLAVWRTTYKRSEEHTSELQSQSNLVCRLLLEKKKK